jgi:hypothetical protein
MKAQLKPLQLAILLTFTSLPFAYAASDTLPLTIDESHFFMSKYIFTPVSNKKIKFTDNNSFNLPEEIFVKAFLDISLKNNLPNQTISAHSNPLFEMAAIFNDNLQYYIAKMVKQKPAATEKKQENEPLIKTTKPTCKST